MEAIFAFLCCFIKRRVRWRKHISPTGLARWCRLFIHATMSTCPTIILVTVYKQWYSPTCSHILRILVKCWNSEKVKGRNSLRVDVQERGNVVEDSWVYHCSELCKLVLHDSLSSLIKATSRWADFAHAKISHPPLSPYSCRSYGMGDLKSSLLTSFLFFLPASCGPLGLDLRDHSSIWKGCILKLSLQPSGDMRRTLENLIFVRSVVACSLKELKNQSMADAIGKCRLRLWQEINTDVEKKYYTIGASH